MKHKIQIMSLICQIGIVLLVLSVGIHTNAEAQENQVLQSDDFDGQELESYWHIQNGDKSPYELIDGKLVVEGGLNQDLWRNDTTTRFYQITNEDQFTVESSFVFDHDNSCSVVGLVISSPTTKDRYGRDGEWVTLKAWGQSHRTDLALQQRELSTSGAISLVDTPPKGDIPMAMRMQRDGDNYNAWYKSEGEGEWIHVGETTIALQEPLQVGLYVGICQPVYEGHLTVSFDNFS